MLLQRLYIEIKNKISSIIIKAETLIRTLIYISDLNIETLN